MSTYKEIHGEHIEFKSSDPGSPNLGQVWYNSTDKKLKLYRQDNGSWSSEAGLNTTRYGVGGAGTTYTSAVAFGGIGTQPTNPGYLTVTETWNGTTWTEVNDKSVATLRPSGAGSSTDAITFSAFNPSIPNVGVTSELWNGTNWTTTNPLNAARRGAGPAGTSTAALAFGGAGPPTELETESWDGTCWTTVNDKLNGTETPGGSGTQTAALSFGGEAKTGQTPVVATESWDGTCWTTVNPFSVFKTVCAGNGTFTSALAYGGPDNSAVTEKWDGTCWSTVGSLLSPRDGNAGVGADNTEAITFGTTSPSTTHWSEVMLSGNVTSILDF